MRIFKHIKDIAQGKTIRGKTRSNKWPKVRAQWLIDHPTCDACGEEKALEVHHKLPFHLFPEKELDPDNLTTLCESKKYGVCCHQLFGHLGDYKDYNEEVERDAEIWSGKLKGRRDPDRTKIH